MEKNQQVSSVFVPLDTYKSFYQQLNNILDPTKGNYFGSIDNCLGLQNDYERFIIDRFKQNLRDYNSIKIWDYLCEAVLTNNPVTFIPKVNNYGYVALDYLTDEDFYVIPVNGGFYTELGASFSSYRGKITVSRIFKRAIQTRFMIMSIMHKIYTDLCQEVAINYDQFVEYYPPNNYINLYVVHDLLTKLLPVKITRTEKKIRIDLDNADKFPAFFKAIRDYDGKMEEFYQRIEQEATARKRSTTIYCFVPSLRETLHSSLIADGFECVRSGEASLSVDWSHAEKEPESSFAHRCWIRTNTMFYYRNCAAFVTRQLNQNPDLKMVILPDNNRPIDNEFFVRYFDVHQAHRCEPIRILDDNDPCYVVNIKNQNEDYLEVKN